MSCHAFAVVPAVLATLALGTARAETVQVQISGVVDYNVIQGGLAGIPSGAPVTTTFLLDSDDYLNSASFPTRGYRIDLGSFDTDVAGVHLTLVDPQAGGDAFFVLRDNDPAVDGFFVSRGGVDLPVALQILVPGLAPVHEFDFSRSFTVGTALSSLDLLDALGTYGFENMGSYQWTVGRAGGIGAEFVYQSITISLVPEPAPWMLLAAGALLLPLLRPRR